MKNKLITLGLRKVGKFKLHSGAESNVFWDVRELYTYPEWMRVRAIGELIWDVGVLHPGKLVGIETGGLSLAHDIGRCLNICVLNQDGYVEAGNEVGRKHGDKTIIIDDVLTTGNTVRKYLKRFGNVIAIAVLINRSGQAGLDGVPIITGVFTDRIGG